MKLKSNRGRKKLSDVDRIENYFTKTKEMLDRDDTDEIKKFLKTIRSKAVRRLLLFNWYKIREPYFEIEHTPKEIAIMLQTSERNVYDLIKASAFVSSVSDVEFHNSISDNFWEKYYNENKEM